MKRISLLFAFVFITLFAKGQVYSKIQKLDKFEDVIDEQNVKTLFSLESSLITVETKGQKPKYYSIIKQEENGRADSVVNLVNDVYGYQTVYYCRELVINDDKSASMDLYKILVIIHRTVTTQYTQTYKTDLWWIYDDDSITSRTVYKNE